MNEMKFDSSTGNIDILPKLSLGRGKTRNEVAACPTEWEDWNIIDGVPNALKTIVRLPNKNISRKTILSYMSDPRRTLSRFGIFPPET